MYAEISQRPPPPRPFLNLLRSPVHLPCVASWQHFLDCPPLLSAYFLTPTTGSCQGATPAERQLRNRPATGNQGLQDRGSTSESQDAAGQRSRRSARYPVERVPQNSSSSSALMVCCLAQRRGHEVGFLLRAERGCLPTATLRAVFGPCSVGSGRAANPARRAPVAGATRIVCNC